MNSPKSLVDRFLAWALPRSVCSDTCVTEHGHPGPRHGTNLLTAHEAGQMFEGTVGQMSLNEMEREMIIMHMARAGRKAAQAAATLGMSQQTLYRRLHFYGLSHFLQPVRVKAGTPAQAVHCEYNCIRTRLGGHHDACPANPCPPDGGSPPFPLGRT